MVLKALILDVDGTIAETSELRRAAYNRAFEELRLGWFWTRAMYQTIKNRALPGRELEYFAANHSPILFRALKDANKLPALRNYQEGYYLDLVDAGAAPLRPGVARLLADAISSGVKVAFCTLGPRAEYESLVYKHFGPEIIDRLGCSVAREDLHTVSPIDAFELVLHRLGTQPAEVIMLDDTAAGIEAAVQLGATTIAAPSAQTTGQNFDAAHLVITDFGHPAAPFNVLKGSYSGPAHLTIDGLRLWHLSQEVGVKDAA